MKKLILTLVAALGLVAGAHAAGGGMAWDKAPVNTSVSRVAEARAAANKRFCMPGHLFVPSSSQSITGSFISSKATFAGSSLASSRPISRTRPT